MFEGLQRFRSKRRATSHPADAQSAGPGHVEVLRLRPEYRGDRTASFPVTGREPSIWELGLRVDARGPFAVSAASGSRASAGGTQSTNNPGGPITIELRVNERIRVPEVRLVGPNGEQVGIVRIED